MAVAELHIGEDHPLYLELASLRNYVAKYQHEVYTASVKLQQHYSEASKAQEQARYFERENARLREEIEYLRSNPDSTIDPATLQVSELTLALRRLSDKLTFMEELLMAKNRELSHARSDLVKAEANVGSYHEAAKRAHKNTQEGRHREHALEHKLRASEEERRLTDLVVQEYANLVRKLEGRHSRASFTPGSPGSEDNNNNTNLVNKLSEGKQGLQKLLKEFNSETDKLEDEIQRLSVDNESLRANLDAERRRSEVDREALASVRTEVDKLKADDNAAAKMVSRYMKFSQSTAESLQNAIANLRNRHASTVMTLNGQIDHLHKVLRTERLQAEKLRNTLDELSEDLSREASGRRREVSLRLAFLGREESLAEDLRRWIRKTQESWDRVVADNGDRINPIPVLEVFNKAIQESERLLEVLNGEPATSEGSPGSVGRIFAARDTAINSLKEAQKEMERRIEVEHRVLQFEFMAENLIDEAHGPLHLTTPPPRRASLRKEIPKALELAPPHAELSKSNVTTAKVYNPLAREIPQTPSSATQEVSLNIPTPQSSPSKPSSVNDTSATVLAPSSDLSQSSVNPSGGKHSRQPSLKDVIEGSTEAPGIEPLVILVSSPETRAIISGEPTELKEQVSKDAEGEAQTSLGVPEIYTSEPEPPQIIISKVEVIHQPSPRPPPQIPSIYVPGSPTTSDFSDGSVEVIPITPLEVTKIDMSDPIPLAITLPEPIQDVFTNATRANGTAMDVDGPSSPNKLHSPLSRHPLLADLAMVKNRYDVLQKAFRNCHLALKEFKNDPSFKLAPGEMFAVLRTAVERLDDFNEDARVELEIRVADEERISKGYETLLSIPGAVSDEVDEGEMEQEIRSFIDGTDKAVSRFSQQFTRKLDDLQHDIACLKRNLHDLAAVSEESPASAPVTTSPSKAWTSWTTGILGGSSRPVSPAPTFGSVMTTPRGLHRHSSLSSLSLTRKQSFSSDHEQSATHSPFAKLGLRIAMPTQVVSAPPSRPSFLTPMGSQPQLKPRTSSSSMYKLGFGARRSSFGLGISTPTGSPRPFGSRLAVSEDVIEDEDDSKGNDDGNSDVE